MLFVAIPTGADDYNNKAYVLNYVDNAWGSYDTQALYGFDLAKVNDLSAQRKYTDMTLISYDEVSGTYQSGSTPAPELDLVIWKQAFDPLLGLNGGAVFFNTDSMIYDSFFSRDQPIQCEAVRYGLAFSGTTGKVVVSEVWPEVTRGSIKIWVGAHDLPERPPTVWDGPFTVSAGDDEPITPLVSGRYLAYKITDTSEITSPGPVNFIATPGERFAFAGMTVNWEQDGEF
jgi:hypothetical protein